MLSQDQKTALIARLDAARRERKQTALPRTDHPDLTLGEAYEVQHAWAATRIANEGRSPVGYKVALTTRGIQRDFAAEGPIYGLLLDDMAYDEAAPVPMDRFLNPRVEMELAFGLSRRLEGLCTEAEAVAAIDWIAPAIELLDSRTVVRDAEKGLSRSAIDIVADAGGAAGYVVSGQRFRPGAADLSRIGAVLYQNGEAEDSGLFPLVFGRPERSLVWLAQALTQHGRAIEPGDVVLSGSVIRPYPAARGDRFVFDYGLQGSISLTFE